MTVDPEQPIRDFTVIIKRTVISQEFTVTGCIAVWNIDQSHVVKDLASDEVE